MAVPVTLLNHKVYATVLRLNAVTCPGNLPVVAMCELGKLARLVCLRVYCTRVQYGVARVVQARVGADSGSDHVQEKELKLRCFYCRVPGTRVAPESWGHRGHQQSFRLCLVNRQVKS